LRAVHQIEHRGHVGVAEFDELGVLEPAGDGVDQLPADDAAQHCPGGGDLLVGHVEHDDRPAGHQRVQGSPVLGVGGVVQKRERPDVGAEGAAVLGVHTEGLLTAGQGVPDRVVEAGVPQRSNGHQRDPTTARGRGAAKYSPQRQSRERQPPATAVGRAVPCGTTFHR